MASRSTSAAAEPPQEWRIRSTRTYGGVLAVCLNVEVEPPDSPFPRALQTGAGRLICGIDPYDSSQQVDPRKVVGRIGKQLETQYSGLHSSRSALPDRAGSSSKQPRRAMSIRLSRRVSRVLEYW